MIGSNFPQGPEVKSPIESIRWKFVLDKGVFFWKVFLFCLGNRQSRDATISEKYVKPEYLFQSGPSIEMSNHHKRMTDCRVLP